MDIGQMVSDWIGVITLQKSFIALKKEKHDLSDGVVNIVVSGLIVGVIFAVLMLLLGSWFAAMNPGASSLIAMGGGTLAAVGAIITVPISSVIGWLIGAGILYIIAMVFGGKADFGGYAAMISYIAAPVALISWIPLIGALAGLWGLILTIMATRDYFNFTTAKAALVVLLPIIILGILGALVAGAFVMSGLGAMGSMYGV